MKSSSFSSRNAAAPESNARRTQLSTTPPVAPTEAIRQEIQFMTAQQLDDACADSSRARRRRAQYARDFRAWLAAAEVLRWHSALAAAEALNEERARRAAKARTRRESGDRGGTLTRRRAARTSDE